MGEIVSRFARFEDHFCFAFLHFDRFFLQFRNNKILMKRSHSSYPLVSVHSSFFSWRISIRIAHEVSASKRDERKANRKKRVCSRAPLLSFARFAGCCDARCERIVLHGAPTGRRSSCWRLVLVFGGVRFKWPESRFSRSRDVFKCTKALNSTTTERHSQRARVTPLEEREIARAENFIVCPPS